MNHVNCITINTDASFHPGYGVGGFAFHIVCDYFKIRKSGKFKKQPLCAREAEEMCIGNAIFVLLSHDEIPKCKLLIINSDCKFAFNNITQAGRNETTAKKVKVLLEQLKTKLGNPKHEFRHVKAHSDIKDARSRINDWCDNEAKKWMRESVKELKLANNEKL